MSPFGGAGDVLSVPSPEQPVVGGGDAVDRNRHRRRAAARERVGEAVGRRRVDRPRLLARIAGVGQMVELAVGIVAVAAVGIERQLRARSQRDRHADIGARRRSPPRPEAADRRHRCRCRSRCAVRIAILRRARHIVIGHRRIVDRGDADRRERARRAAGAVVEGEGDGAGQSRTGRPRRWRRGYSRASARPSRRRRELLKVTTSGSPLAPPVKLPTTTPW